MQWLVQKLEESGEAHVNGCVGVGLFRDVRGGRRPAGHFQYGGLPAWSLHWRRGVAAEAPSWKYLTSRLTLFLNHGAVILCSQVRYPSIHVH